MATPEDTRNQIVSCAEFLEEKLRSGTLPAKFDQLGDDLFRVMMKVVNSFDSMQSRHERELSHWEQMQFRLCQVFKEFTERMER